MQSVTDDRFRKLHLMRQRDEVRIGRGLPSGLEWVLFAMKVLSSLNWSILLQVTIAIIPSVFFFQTVAWSLKPFWFRFSIVLRPTPEYFAQMETRHHCWRKADNSRHMLRTCNMHCS